ncbi:acetyl-CoA C-acyltransferase domain protein [Trichuris suis]|nr:acetyl-CoA C-acyltransferase domain protein [Trichuris suis]
MPRIAALPALRCLRSFSSSVSAPNTPVVVEGVRSPFLVSFTNYKHMYTYELLKHALIGLTRRLNLNPANIDYVVAGTVIQEVRTTNVAREAALVAGIPDKVPAYTVTMACISSNQAITSCMEVVRSGVSEVAVAAGVELMSDVPIRISRYLRRNLLDANRAKTLYQRMPMLLRLANPMNWALELRRNLSHVDHSSFWHGILAPVSIGNVACGSGAFLVRFIHCYFVLICKHQIFFLNSVTTNSSSLGASFQFPAITEFSSNETMGHSADRLASSFGVSRSEQDEFALRSHTLADKAFKNGKLTDLLQIVIPGNKEPIVKDNGIRVSSLEKLASLKPAFRHGIGTITAGNASFLSDGASACLITTEAKAKALGLKPKARLREYVYVAQDPKNQLLLGPAYAIPKLLDKIKMKISDIDVFELHEAFAGQLIANLKALDSDHFAQKYLNKQGKVGSIPIEKLNCWGGSLSLGHPFGATGVRLLSHAVNRLIDENGKYAIVSACAAGGLGHALLVERIAG